MCGCARVFVCACACVRVIALLLVTLCVCVCVEAYLRLRASAGSVFGLRLHGSPPAFRPSCVCRAACVLGALTSWLFRAADRHSPAGRQRAPAQLRRADEQGRHGGQQTRPGGEGRAGRSPGVAHSASDLVVSRHRRGRPAGGSRGRRAAATAE